MKHVIIVLSIRSAVYSTNGCRGPYKISTVDKFYTLVQYPHAVSQKGNINMGKKGSIHGCNILLKPTNKAFSAERKKPRPLKSNVNSFGKYMEKA